MLIVGKFGRAGSKAEAQRSGWTGGAVSVRSITPERPLTGEQSDRSGSFPPIRFLKSTDRPSDRDTPRTNKRPDTLRQHRKPALTSSSRCDASEIPAVTF